MHNSQSRLRSQLIRLAHQRPDLRPHLLPLLAAQQGSQNTRTASRFEEFTKSQKFPNPLTGKDTPYDKLPLAEQSRIHRLFEYRNRKTFSDLAEAEIKKDPRAFLASHVKAINSARTWKRGLEGTGWVYKGKIRAGKPLASGEGTITLHLHPANGEGSDLVFVLRSNTLSGGWVDEGIIEGSRDGKRLVESDNIWMSGNPELDALAVVDAVVWLADMLAIRESQEEDSSPVKLPATIQSLARKYRLTDVELKGIRSLLLRKPRLLEKIKGDNIDGKRVSTIDVKVEIANHIARTIRPGYSSEYSPLFNVPETVMLRILKGFPKGR